MDNPQAFPTHGGTEGDDARNRILTGGMTLRDYFAGQALAGMLANPDRVGHNIRFDAWAADAYRLSDAMLAERKSHEADRAFKEALS